MKLKKYFIVIFSLVIILLFQGKYILERSSKIIVMKKGNAEDLIKVNSIKNTKEQYYKDFSFYNIVEATYSIDKKVRLSRIEKNSDSSFTLTINFDTKEVNIKEVVQKLKKIKYFYKIDTIEQDGSGKTCITFTFNNQHKIENTV